MNIQIRADNLEISDNTKSYARRKVRALTKYLGGIPIIEATVKLVMTSKHHQKGDIYECEMALKLPRETVRVSKVASDMLKSIDKVRDHLERSIDKYKEKHTI